MSEEHAASSESAVNAQPTSHKSGSFIFRSVTSAPPIRFNPDTPERFLTPSVGSRSSLSSSMTPETITLTIKPSTEISGTSSTKDNPNTDNSNATSLSETPRSVPVMDRPTRASLGSSDGKDSVMEASPTPPAAGAPYQAPSEGPKPPGKLTTQYVMPDGSVITGKGLGRGRPGVKRGPRKSNLPGEGSAESTTSGSPSVRPAVETPAGAKRKRADSEASQIRARSVSSSLHSRESSVEYNPTATQTRSGRQTQKPIPLVVPVATPTTTASPASKKMSASIAATPTFKTHPKIKRKVYRGKEQFALCEHCLRGFGPPGNVIVFCDACNKCWHQLCHQPQIPKDIVNDTKAEWFCATCDKILHGNKRAKKPPPKPEAPIAPPPELKFGLPLVGAIALTLEQRVKYLESLSREKLIGLLLRAGELAPQMPVFETPILPPSIVPLSRPQFTSSYVTPVSEVPAFIKAGSHDVPDEGYDDTYDEHAALYPKVGEGVKLPPEREDLNILLEGPESRTFSHWVKGQPVKTVVDTVPLHQSQFTKQNR